MIAIMIVCVTGAFMLLLLQLVLSLRYRNSKKRVKREAERITKTDESYREVVEKNHRLMQLRHDLAKLKRLTDEAGTSDGPIEAQDKLVGILLDEYKRIADENGICFQVDYSRREDESSMIKNLPLPDLDVARILTNLLDNAFEACLRLPDDAEKQVKVTTDDSFICVENTKREDEHPKENGFETTKEEKDLHGHGINVIRELIREHGGTVKGTDFGDRFRVEIRF